MDFASYHISPLDLTTFCTVSLKYASIPSGLILCIKAIVAMCRTYRHEQYMESMENGGESDICLGTQCFCRILLQGHKGCCTNNQCSCPLQVPWEFDMRKLNCVFLISLTLLCMLCWMRQRALMLHPGTPAPRLPQSKCPLVLSCAEMISILWSNDLIAAPVADETSLCLLVVRWVMSFGVMLADIPYSRRQQYKLACLL